MQRKSLTYLPLDTLKSVTDDVWIVDGPVIRFGMPWPKMPFSTRMTVLRVNDELMIHSPTPLIPALKQQIDDIGQVRWIIGPNRIHYWWIPEWRDAFPGADVYLAPRIREQSRGRIDFPVNMLERDSGYPWDGAIETLPVRGSFMTEVVFFHRASRTLLLTDLIENFEPSRIGSFWHRWLVRLGGALAPHGSMPRDMRITFRKQRIELKAAVEKMISWHPERVLLAHGRWYDREGTAELKRAFHWLLE